MHEAFKKLVKVKSMMYLLLCRVVYRIGFCFKIADFVVVLKVTEECLEKGIAVCKDGASFKKIGKRIR